MAQNLFADEYMIMSYFNSIKKICSEVHKTFHNSIQHNIWNLMFCDFCHIMQKNAFSLVEVG